jgi:hypothetical protein
MVELVDRKTPDQVVGVETTHGYFKLDPKAETKLDLRSYDKSRVMWLYFTAIKPQNPQRRAWLHAIRGPAFGESRLCGKTIALNEVALTSRYASNGLTYPSLRLMLFVLVKSNYTAWMAN